MFWRRGYTLRGEVGGGWALEFPSFLGPVKWHRADRRVPFGAVGFVLIYRPHPVYGRSSYRYLISCLSPVSTPRDVKSSKQA